MQCPTILKLNDDCLLKVFSHLSFRELRGLELVCWRFHDLVKDTYRRRYKELDFAKLDWIFPIKIKDALNVVEMIGSHVHTVKLLGNAFEDSRKFQTDFTFINFVLRQCSNNNLEHIEIEGFKMSSQQIELLCEKVGNLKTLRLSDCHLDDEIGRVLERATKLESLYLSGNSRIQGTFLPVLKNLQEIDLQQCGNFSTMNEWKSHIIAFCRSNSTIRKINIVGWMNANQETLREISGLKNLESLSIAIFQTSGNPLILADLAQLKNLQIFLFDHFKIEELILLLDSLATRDQLQELGVIFPPSPASLTLDVLSCVKRFTSLKLLNIPAIDVKSNFLMELSCKETLEYVCIAQTWYFSSDYLYRFIREYPKLRGIDIRGCRKISNDFIEMLLPHLNQRQAPLEVMVYGTGITDDPNHPKLRLNWTSTHYYMYDYRYAAFYMLLIGVL